MAQRVWVVPYDPRWAAMFEREKALLEAAFGQELVAIHHIGSTAVPGLPAKPIIDILPVVRDIGRQDRWIPALEALSYECLGEFGIPGRCYCRKGGDCRTHQLHIFGQQSEFEIRRHLAVRDYLRAHAAERRTYGQLKEELAIRFPEDIEAYCDGKDAVVKALEKKALRWLEERERGRLP